MLYDYPQYYEVAFSFRDIEREAAFLDRCIAEFSRTDVKRVFELACGPAPHAGELTRRGYHYVGLDINRNMLDYAESKWCRLDPRPVFIEGDMTAFSCPDRADFAFVMLGSLYLNSLDDMVSHFDCMTRILQSGGLYFLDWCIQFNDPLTPRATNAVTESRDGIVVESKFNIRLVDSARQMYEEVWTVDVDDHGRHQRFSMTERNRAIFPQEFLLFVESRTDFEFVGWWHDWDLDKPIIGNAEIIRPVVILRRK